MDCNDVKLRQRALAALLGLIGPGLAVSADSDPSFLLLPPESAENAVDASETGFRVPLARILGRLQSAVAVGNPGDGRAHTFLTIDAGHGLSLLCDGSYGLTAALADVGRHCLQGRLDANGWNIGQVTSVGIDHSLRLDDDALPFDLNFGLSWLRADLDDATNDGALDLFDGRFQPSAGLLDQISGETVSLSGTQWLSERSWLRVTGSNSRLRNDHPLLATPMAWSSSALRVDAGFGDFAGSLTGHRTESSLTTKSWFDIDFGVSWRTPWSGRLTVGARNLLGNDATANSAPGENETTSRLLESRTPYVRYQQDL